MSTSASTADAAAPRTPGVSRIFALLLSGEIANKLTRFAAAAVLARTLSPDDYGVFNVGIAVAGLVVSFGALGLPEVVGREAAIGGTDLRATAGRVLAIRLVAVALGAVFGGAAVGLAGLAGWDAIVSVVAMVAAMSASADWLARALSKAGGLGSATACGGVVALVGAVALLALGGSAVAALAVFSLGELVATLLTWRVIRVRPRLRLDGAGDLLRRSWPVAVSSLVIYSYYANVDTVIMAATRSQDEAGLYSAAYRVFLTFNVLAIFVAYANFPTLSRASAAPAERAAAHDALRRSVRLLGAVGCLTLAGAVLCGGWVLGILFGHRFEAMGDTEIMLCTGLAWYMVGYPLGYSLVARGANRRFMVGATTAGVLSLALDLVLIPPFGAIGAGVATAGAFLGAAIVWIGFYGAMISSVRRTWLATAASSVLAIAAEFVVALRPALAAALVVLAAWLALGALRSHAARSASSSS